MCYDLHYLTRKQYRYAKLFGDKEDIEEIERELKIFEEKYFPKYHTNGFAHEKLPVITNETNMRSIQFIQWGLIPFWTKNEDMAKQLSNQTINARGETIFEKPSFREPANKRRCVILVDGFFEHHHFKSKTYPFLIKHKNDEPMFLGGLFDIWVNKETGEEIKSVSIVTTKANSLMAKIHNNPKLNEPRMPVILKSMSLDTWLYESKEDVQQLLKPYPEEELEYYTVRKLRGKESVGNVPEALEKYDYEELPTLQ